MTDPGPVDLDSVATSLATVGHDHARSSRRPLGEGVPAADHGRGDVARTTGSTAGGSPVRPPPTGPRVATALAVESAGYEAEVAVADRGHRGPGRPRRPDRAAAERPGRPDPDRSGTPTRSPAHLAVRRLVGPPAPAVGGAARTRCGSAPALPSPGCSMELFDLQHGFWVMLTVLVLMRTSAADTAPTLRPALTGTLVGSVVAGAPGRHRGGTAHRGVPGALPGRTRRRADGRPARRPRLGAGVLHRRRRRCCSARWPRRPGGWPRSACSTSPSAPWSGR